MSHNKPEIFKPETKTARIIAGIIVYTGSHIKYCQVIAIHMGNTHHICSLLANMKTTSDSFLLEWRYHATRNGKMLLIFSQMRHIA